MKKKKSWNSGVTTDVVTNAAQCHLRPERLGHVKANRCELCKINASFKTYSDHFNLKQDDRIEILNFERIKRHQQRNDDNDCNIQSNENEAQNKFTTETFADILNPSDLEKIFKHLIWFSKRDPEYKKDSLESIQKLISQYDYLKDEQRKLSNFIECVSNQIGAFDTLEKVKIRVRLPTWLEEEEERREDEEIRTNERLRAIEAKKDEKDRIKITKLKRNFFLEPHVIKASSLEVNFEKQQQEKDEREKKLRKKLNQLLYLKNLEKTYEMVDGEINEDPCTICYENLGYEWFILECGHLYCKICTEKLLKSCEKRNYLKCPMCRDLCLHSESYLVSTLANSSKNNKEIISYNNNEPMAVEYKDELSDVNISGLSNSAKVEGVVKCLLKIITNDKNAKCIVFSEHFVILDLIISLLKQNEITYRYIRGVKSQKPVDDFKTDKSVNVLLMLYLHGANGKFILS